MSSAIVIRNFTCLDHAYVDAAGMVCGGSYNVSVTLRGEVVGNEAVVIDFSKAKKACKEAIDDNRTGYDHKLILYPWSKVEVTPLRHGLTLISPFLEICCPEDAVNVVTISLEAELERLIDNKLKNLFPEAQVSSDVSLSTHPFSDGEYSMFSYVHGLKHSSSYGCQNMNHGHLSFIEVEGPTARLVADQIAGYLNGTVFINKENIVFEDDEWISIGYQCNRGYFRSKYSKEHKIVILNSETTAENLVEYVQLMFPQYMTSRYKIIISEGLQKGAIVNE